MWIQNDVNVFNRVTLNDSASAECSVPSQGGYLCFNNPQSTDSIFECDERHMVSGVSVVNSEVGEVAGGPDD